MTDTFTCEQCGARFDEFEMNFAYSSRFGKCLCHTCIEARTLNNYLKQSKLAELDAIQEERLITNISIKFPGVRVIRIHDSWVFEVPEDKVVLYHDELVKYLEKEVKC